MTRLAGKVAVVTGASKGIGAAIAKGLAAAGALASDDARWLTGERLMASGGSR